MPTIDSNLTRDELIEMALQKIGIAVNSTLTSRAVKVLNLLMREIDPTAKHLWAISESTLKLTASQWVYTAAATDGLETDVLDLLSVVYRNSSGEDSQVEIYSTEQYNAITDKYETGDTEVVYLKRDKTLSSHLLYVWPVPSSVGTTTSIVGTDANNYNCIKNHTSAAANRPITGANWRMYWGQKAASGDAWVTATDYTAGELLRYSYKRALYDFDASSDNPDMPQSWTRYLMYRLAYDLAPEFDVDHDSRKFLRQEYLEAYENLFPSNVTKPTAIHNKALFY